MYDNVKKYHEGIDYGCPEGTPILASAEGIVLVVANSVTGYGNFIIIRHANNSGTVYAHLSRVLVKTNQVVNQGDVIGYSGNTGNSSGPHLHFEYRRIASDYSTAEDPKGVLMNVIDTPAPPAQDKTGFAKVNAGTCIVVCDTVNARCHCDMSLVKDQLHRGDIISVGEQVTEYMGLPFRDFWDAKVNCWLRIAEHDITDQLIENHEVF